MQNESTMTTTPRYALIDGLRGITLISMILFHFSYDVFIVYGKNPDWYGLTSSHIWQQSICQTFILISGFVWSWGRKGNLKRGIFLNLCGLLITAVTYFAMPSEVIWFGILNFMGCAVLLMIPLEKITAKVPAAAGLCCCFVLFLFFLHVQSGTVGFGDLLQIKVPSVLYESRLLTPFGFPFDGFRSGDYFPILPWFFLYLCGYFLQRLLMPSEKFRRLAQIKLPVFSFIGRKTIWVYMLHQPVCMGISMLLFG